MSTSEAVESKGKPQVAESDFDLAPFLVFWEVTRTCTLPCRHCRAAAQPQGDKG